MIGVLFWGAQRGTSQILFVALISDEAPKKITGTAIGLFYIITGVVALAAGFFAGKLGEIGLYLTFTFGACMGGAAMVLLFLRKRFLNHQKRREAKRADLETLYPKPPVTV